MKSKYLAAKSSILSDEQAERYGTHIETMLEDFDVLKPDDVLNDAVSPKSPLHDFFEWDDSLAAQKYRVNQAAYLLRSIHVTVKVDREETNIRAFHRVVVRHHTSDNGGKGAKGYVTLTRVMSDKELRAQIIEEALRQLQSWRDKYKQYSEFSLVFSAIDEMATVNALVAA